MSSAGRPTVESVHSITANSAGPAATSLWTRLSGYISEHKAVVYTVGAVVIVATAGGIYYISQTTPTSEDDTGKEKKTKKDRRKRDVKDSAQDKAEKSDAGEMMIPPPPLTPPCKALLTVERLEEALRRECREQYPSGSRRGYRGRFVFRGGLFRIALHEHC